MSAIYKALEHKTSYEDGEGDRRELQKGGDICIPMAESCWGLTVKQQNSVKQLIFNKK